MPDHSLDVVVASHVREHVDDRAALRSLHRVLKPGGLLVALVPIVEAWPTTYENAAVVDPKERLLHFGQEDHVRYYGRDFVDRLRAVSYTHLDVYKRQGPGRDAVAAYRALMSC